ncbi:hypothetical protein [Pseudomonas alvandae]|jgi:hypothetical protein|uniref:Uncharacterized protein n=1 Tax=Pseudomonas canavaninivorans TaxID=2842348 RepID=A0ABX8QGW8_PSECO|nr:hypothetical protein [Pseudomonas alvandae]QXI54655.1 hypothetical protein KSS97_06860 [Pseudomonas alvandae]
MNVDKTPKAVIVEAERDGQWAQLSLEYSWSENGTMFTVRTINYIASNNGRSEGNIKLALVSAGDTGWRQLTGSGIQDGKWHEFGHTVSVQGNNRTAVIHFNWIYDQAWPRNDINMTGAWEVTK